MEGTYPLYWDGKQAGAVTVTRQGLYYDIRCHCPGLTGQRLELMAMGTAGEENLGLLVPMGRGMGMDIRIPVKRLGQGQGQMTLRSRENRDNAVEIDPERPFPYLQQLDRAYLVIRQGRVLIGFQENPEKGKNSA